MLIAVYKEDLAFSSCPVYVYNEHTDMFVMNRDTAFTYKKEDVLSSEDFMVFDLEDVPSVYV